MHKYGRLNIKNSENYCEGEKKKQSRFFKIYNGLEKGNTPTFPRHNKILMKVLCKQPVYSGGCMQPVGLGQKQSNQPVLGSFWSNFILQHPVAPR